MNAYGTKTTLFPMPGNISSLSVPWFFRRIISFRDRSFLLYNHIENNRYSCQNSTEDH